MYKKLNMVTYGSSRNFEGKLVEMNSVGLHGSSKCEMAGDRNNEGIVIMD